MTCNALKLAGPDAPPEAAPPDAFRQVMRELASGVALVTTSFERARVGCAVTSVTSLSLGSLARPRSSAIVAASPRFRPIGATTSSPSRP